MRTSPSTPASAPPRPRPPAPAPRPAPPPPPPQSSENPLLNTDPDANQSIDPGLSTPPPAPPPPQSSENPLLNTDPEPNQSIDPGITPAPPPPQSSENPLLNTDPEPNQSIDPNAQVTIYVISYGGKDYYGTRAEIDALLQRIINKLDNDIVAPLRNTADLHAGRIAGLEQLNNENSVISWFVEVAGGADLGASRTALKAEQDAVAALSSAIRSNPGGNAEALYKSAVEAANATGAAISTYMDKLESGAGDVVTVLKVVEVSCFAIAQACATAAIAPVGMVAIASTGGLTGMGFGGLQAIAEEGAPLAYGDKVDYRQAGANIAKSIVLNGIGGFLGSAAGAAFKGEVAAALVRELEMSGPAVDAILKKKIEDFVEGAIGGAVQTVVAATLDPVKMPKDEFLRLVVTNIIAGGIGNVIGVNFPKK